MAPPPSTPAPSRFLISKRPSTQQPRSQTPNPQHASGPYQFHATPRFSSTSTPRPPSTPALAIKPRVLRARSTQDIIDDSSPVSDHGDSPAALPEPIELDSSLVPQSSPPPEAFETVRSSKRRRISIASSESEPAASSPDPAAAASLQRNGTDLESLPDAPSDGDEADPISSDHPRPPSWVDDNYLPEQDEPQPDSPFSPPSPSATGSDPASQQQGAEPDEPYDSSDSEEAEGEATAPWPGLGDIPEPSHHHPPPPHHLNPNRPAFRPAPRFKPPDDSHQPHPLQEEGGGGSGGGYLPDIFSPQRRGVRYKPGGLAAELRGWLVEVKEGVGVGVVDGDGDGFAGEKEKKEKTKRALLRVDRVRRGGAGMTLVSGWRVYDDNGAVDHDAEGEKVILAGEGMIQGLGGRGGNWGRVVPGAVVGVASPAWEVELGVEGRWTVAYRWEVVRDGEEAGDKAGPGESSIG